MAEKMFRAVIRNAAGTVVHVSRAYDREGDAKGMVTRRTWGDRTGTVEETWVSWTEVGATASPDTPPLHEFSPWPKTARLFRDIIVTEKIDGTNGAIVIRPLTATQFCPADAKYASDTDGNLYAVFAQSRKRIITPGKSTDNHGFAAWVWDNATELVALLGPGMHFGEWWGSGINRAYGLTNGEKRFSLFNTHKWGDQFYGGGHLLIGGTRLDMVPVLYHGPFSQAQISAALSDLKTYGSTAAPGFMNPEGVCVYHSATRQTLKVTLDNNDAGKWETL